MVFCKNTHTHTHRVLRHIVLFLQMVYDFLKVLESYRHFQNDIGYLLCVLATGNSYVFRVNIGSLNAFLFYFSTLSGKNKHIRKAWRAITQEHEHISGDRRHAGNSWPITDPWCHAKHYRCAHYKCKVTVVLPLCIFICVEEAENMSGRFSRARLALWLNIFTNPGTKHT